MKTREVSRDEAAKRLLELKRAGDSYKDYLALRHPEWKHQPFHLKIITALDALERGTLTNHTFGTTDAPERPIYNLLLNMPPRAGKSQLTTVNFPPYFLGRDPRRFVMSTSYGTQLARDFGRDVRNSIADPITSQIFPDLSLSRDSTAADALATTMGGKYFSISTEGTTSGRPANLLIVDDPIKSRKDAESPSLRDRVWRAYNGQLAVRLENAWDGSPPKQIVVLTRWHVDDLAGRIMQTEEWKDSYWLHLNFPAIISTSKPETKTRATVPVDFLKAKKNDPATNEWSGKRKLTGNFVETEETSFWEENFPLERLLRRRAMNEADFTSLYQQQPTIEGGNLIKDTDWQTYAQPEKEYQAICISADTAFSTKETADYTAIIVGGLTQSGDIHILKVIRERMDYPTLRHRMTSLITAYRGKGLRGVYIEDRASGQSLVQDMRKNGGIPVIAVKVPNDNVTRLHAVLPMIQGGLVYLPNEADWLDEFRRETNAFPSAPHDDQVDALSILLDAMSRMAGGVTADMIMMSPLSQQRPPTEESLRALFAPDRKPFRGYGL
jgi:predicted phage terminase large subunit-like protein